MTLNLYAIDGRRAHLIKSPDLFKKVTGREVGDDDGLRQRISMVEWKGGNRSCFADSSRSSLPTTAF